jgi:hypothetical protein
MTPDLDELVECGEELQRTCPGFMDGKVLIPLASLKALSADLAAKDVQLKRWTDLTECDPDVWMAFVASMTADLANAERALTTQSALVQKQAAVIERLREALDKASEALLQGADWMDEKGHMAQCNWLQRAYDRARSALSEG